MTDYINQNTTIDDVETALSTIEISIRKENGDFRETYDVLHDIGMIWEGLSDVQQSIIINAIEKYTN